MSKALNNHTHILLIVLMGLNLVACSTQKNTPASRSFHQTKTYFNIYYNGRLSYDEGMKVINQANQDDFSGVLALYPVSNHTAAQGSTSQMNQAIDKCRKCIKLHSIKAKPQKIDAKRRQDPKYKLWLQSKEFNNKMYLAWMMLGQSEFHKGDFLGAVGTFNYVAKLYENDVDIVAQCKLWVARAYGEMGWLYEAEDMVSKIKVDDLKRKHQPLYSAVMADILLKQQRYHDALPFVKVARENESRKGYSARFEYVLGQLYQMDGQQDKAKSAYQRVDHLNPSPELAFNARLHYAELEGDTVKTVKRLLKQAKLAKNKDHLDQLYGTIGNIYLMRRDTNQAIHYYLTGIDKSTQMGVDKAAVLIHCADLYYAQGDYEKAAPLYQEASTIITNTHPDYRRVRHLGEVLGEVAVHTTAIALQDSLKHLSTLTEDEQIAIVDKIINDLIAQETADSIKAAEEARAAELGSGTKSVNTMGMLGGGGGDKSWYFYNANLLKNGREEFTRQWGRRTLEDDWRRQSKAMSSGFSMMDSGEEEEDDDMELQMDSLSMDSLMTDSLKPEIPEETDPHQRAYYLQQIPRTEEDLRAADGIIATSLYTLVGIYKYKVLSDTLAEETYLEMMRRFPADERLIELQRMLHPDSTEIAMALHQRTLGDSLYRATYEAYRKAQFKTVKQNKLTAEQELAPASPLMPRFLFLNAIAMAKSEGQPAFIVALRDMVERYPTSELGAMAKDMLAMITQGAEAETDGQTMAQLTNQRTTAAQEEDTIPSNVKWSVERKEKTYVMLIMPTNEEKLHQLLYEVALYNFTQFLIKDFDLFMMPLLTPATCALQIAGFESMDEAEWYMGLIEANADLSAVLRDMKVQTLPITETNYKLIGHPFTWDDYSNFWEK